MSIGVEPQIELVGESHAPVMVANNGQALLPQVLLVWDDKKQQVDVKFEPKEFRSWQFIKHVLQMALENVDATIEMNKMMGMDQAIAEARRTSKIAANVLRGK